MARKEYNLKSIAKTFEYLEFWLKNIIIYILIIYLDYTKIIGQMISYRENNWTPY